MGKIRQLPLHEIQKIAAGEVIDRPANIVKELVENSLDAAATHIKIYINDGGKTLIRIIDNGCGMSHDDALMCCVHHATSKIQSIADLESVQTFGFRGEALSSIVAVARVTLSTRHAQDEHGTTLTFEQGQIMSDTMISLIPGSDILVEDLFYTVPARKKFLKNTDTEWRQILLLVQAYCLDYRSIHFELHHNDHMIINCPPVKSFHERVTQLWDHRMSSSMLVVEGKNERNDIILEGLVSNHQFSRYDRSHIFMFVNSRWIKNQHLSKAILKSYANVLPPGKYPCAIICLTVDQLQVDINIHPRKEEVKFLHPQTVESVIHNAIHTALQSTLKQVPVEQPREQESLHIKNAAPVFFKETYNTPVFTFSKPDTIHPKFTENKTEKPQIKEQPEQLLTVQEEQQEFVHKDNLVEESFGTIIGQYLATYILIERNKELMIVDQHAAHERILYERLSNRFNDIATVQLVFPLSIIVAPDDFIVLDNHKHIFAAYGIIIEPFGQNSFIVSATPVQLQNIDFNDLIKQFIGCFHENHGMQSSTLSAMLHDKLRASMACKAAVKAGDVLTIIQMEQIMKDLSVTENNLTCPHGRPTRWIISSEDLEKKFKRDYRSKAREF